MYKTKTLRTRHLNNRKVFIQSKAKKKRNVVLVKAIKANRTIGVIVPHILILSARQRCPAAFVTEKKVILEKYKWTGIAQ